MIKPLTCVINRLIYMTYGSRQRCPESRTAQLGSHPAALTRAPASGRRAPGSHLLHLQAPGLSLSRAGTAAQTPGPGRRCESVFHGQALAQSGRQTPDLRSLDRIDLERDRQPCLVGGTASRGRTWLTGRRVGNGRCGWNINSIGYCQRSWRGRTSCSCPPESGRRPEPLPDKPAASRRF